jgi:GNAT superfamily N-acetyltransferase
MLSIRQAYASDAEACSAVLCASIRELCMADHKSDAELIAQWLSNKTPEHLVRWATNPRSVLLLAERDGAPAGVGSVSIDGEVLLNYVAPAHRFTGVSRAMLGRLEGILCERGIGTARLTSTETAHRFYRAAGWVDIGVPRTMFGITGYPMQKQLLAATLTRQSQD